MGVKVEHIGIVALEAQNLVDETSKVGLLCSCVLSSSGWTCEGWTMDSSVTIFPCLMNDVVGVW